MKKLALIVAIASLSMIAYLYYQQNKECARLQSEISRMKNDSQNVRTQFDSLKNELFIAQTNQTRYEIAIDYLKEEDVKAWERLERILRTKTE